MGIFSQKSKIKAAPQTIRVEKVVVPPKPKPKSSLNPNSALRTPSISSKSPRPSPRPQLNGARGSASPYPSSEEKKSERKRKAICSTPRDYSPAFGNDSESEDNEDGDPFSSRLKRRRQSDGRFIDTSRRLKHKKAFPENGTRGVDIIHAADVASVATKCAPIFGASSDQVAVELQYPSLCQRERYELVWKKDKIDAVKDIIKVIKHVAESFLSEQEAAPLTESNNGFIRQLERASNEKIADLSAFKTALSNYNDELLPLLKSDAIAKRLESRHHLPSDLVAFILEQVYDRTVAPKVELLAKYQAGSDNVYGELMHPFITKILVEQTRMTSEKVFVDLGSGVGNVVLQAALEIGCRSYGCEMMENACNLAEAQEKEFKARCMLWGIAPGRVYLERGDFRTNKRTLEAVKEADVILVNNKAFTSVLNDALINMFLDLKPGCKIISLKSFVSASATAINDIASSIFDVEEYRYHGGWVSWAGSEGDYYISTRK